MATEDPQNFQDAMVLLNQAEAQLANAERRLADATGDEITGAAPVRTFTSTEQVRHATRNTHAAYEVTVALLEKANRQVAAEQVAQFRGLGQRMGL